jgi:hypothetical protein
MATTTTITTHFVLAINVSRPWQLQRNDLWPRLNESGVYVSRAWGDRLLHPCVNGSLAVASACVAVSAPTANVTIATANSSSFSPLAGAVAAATAAAGVTPLPDLQSHSASASGRYALGESPFVLLAIHQPLPNGWVLWEEDKYVSVSRGRLFNVTALFDPADADIVVDDGAAAGSDADTYAVNSTGAGGGGGRRAGTRPGAAAGAGVGGVSFVLRGAAGEVVKLVALRPQQGGAGSAVEWTVVSVHAVIGPAGLTSVEIR